MNDTIPTEDAVPAQPLPTPAAAVQPDVAAVDATVDATVDAAVDAAADEPVSEPASEATLNPAPEPESAPGTEAAAEAPAEQPAATPQEAAAESVSAVSVEPAEPAGQAELSPAATAKALAERFPALFGTEARPIKLRIQADIQQRAPGLFTRKALSIFLHRHTTSTAYLKALAASEARFDLDGQAAGELAEEHREAARVELARRREVAEARRAAEREKARAERDQAREAARQAERAAQREQQKAQRKERQQAAREWEQKKAEGLAADIERERQRAQADAQTQEQRDRAALVHAWQTTTLTRANFLTLKRISGELLDAALAQHAAEAAARRR